MTVPSRFNVRVYGLMLNEVQQVLVSDERYGTRTFSKFPGGGLEFGEGVVDCLKREFMEEAQQPVEVTDHFYTTEDFFRSAFNPAQQVLSIYFRVQPNGPLAIPVSDTPFNFKAPTGNEVVFRWVPTTDLDPAQFTFPIDKIVAGKLSQLNF